MSKVPMLSKPLKKRQRDPLPDETDRTAEADKFVSGAAVATSPAIVKTSDKPAKPKFERKNFRFTVDELQKIDELKVNLLLASREKGETVSLYDNEIVRLGVLALAKMSTDDVLALVSNLPRAK
ncbi:hypothetical protein [Thalassospira marina]|uniref:Uncharacterized protein n=1 Tax=Thalassospira marina TaxID=2048283 RepID=A0A2N3KJ36_9PROT|nr:hypothetical protein [Thalassospira marina]PKR50483.1 hypothetical protein COO20_21670 [Thalassospira marina]|tara:strand:- start:571 stop:942 length:372 start_codon:yes stop_codon:yes gene_type:complete